MNKIFMPSSGQTTDQLIVAQWLKKIGDPVNRGDALLEIETDKATQEIQSYAKGVLLKVMAKEGDTVSSGDLIALVGEPGELDLEKEQGQTLPRPSPVVAESISETKPNLAASEITPTPTVLGLPAEPISEEYIAIVKGAFIPALPVTTVPPAQGSVKPRGEMAAVQSSPAAKHAARIFNVDIHEIADILKKVSIKKKDVEDFVNRADTDDLALLETIPLTKTRRIIAERLTSSATTVPTYQVEVEIDMESCIDLRECLNRQEGKPKVSFHDLVVLGVCAVVDRHPLINGTYTAQGTNVFRHVNVGIAVSSPAGLIVPVVRRASELGIRGIAAESRKLIEAVRAGRQTPEMLTCGTITISNLGIFPVSRFTSLLNPPQSSILSLGVIQKRVVYRNGEVVVRSMMNVTGTFDHRIVDGAYGASFLADLKEVLENPALFTLRKE